jgi:hypothetical protein
MKQQILSAVVTLGFALGALAQGTIDLSDYNITPRVATDTAGYYYTGTFGIQVWGINAAAVPAGINVSPGPGSGVAAYNAMVADGFTLEATFVNQTMDGGAFGLGAITLPTIPGPEAVIALVAWNTSAASWGAMLGSANANTRAGVIAFVNPVTVLIGNPNVPAALTGWTQDLVMTSVPEPGAFPLAGLGAAVVLLLRRRQCAEGARDAG